LLNNFSLLVDQQLRVTDDVDEQNVRNRQMGIGFQLSGHFSPPGELL
jgi:hypothetical protein